MTWRIRLRETEPVMQAPHWRTDVLAGFAHIRQVPELRRLVAAGAAVIGISGIAAAAQYRLVQALGEPPSFLGVLSAGLGAGSMVASLTSIRLLRRVGEGWLSVIGTANFGLGGPLRATGWLPAAIARSVAIGYASYRVVYIASAAFALAGAAWLIWSLTGRHLCGSAPGTLAR